MARDDFDKEAKEILARRVGYKCSNPNCQQSTSGPQVNPKKAVNIGVAAHISAAAIGGPRFDASLTPEERKSPGNGIWLCQNCAKLIDNDEDRYPIHLLLEWKQQAERAALKEIEQPKAAYRDSSFTYQSYIDSYNHVIYHNTYNIFQEKRQTPSNSQTSRRQSKPETIVAKLSKSLLLPIKSSFWVAIIMIFAQVLCLIFALAIVSISSGDLILISLIIGIAPLSLSIFLFGKFFQTLYPRVYSSGFYSLKIGNRRQTKWELQQQSSENEILDWYIYFAIQVFLIIDKRVAEKLSRFFS